MSGRSFDDVLAQARQLASEDQQRLILELAAPESDNGGPQRSLYDALKARGIIGCLKDAPPDLSTNPKYLESLGQHGQ
jgi:hypothetical protein